MFSFWQRISAFRGIPSAPAPVEAPRPHDNTRSPTLRSYNKCAHAHQVHASKHARSTLETQTQCFPHHVPFAGIMIPATD